MDKDYLTLKRASASRSSGGWNDDDFDVLCDGVVVGRIMKVAAPPVGSPWMRTLAFGHHEDRTPIHGYAGASRAGITGRPAPRNSGEQIPYVDRNGHEADRAR